MSSKSKLGWILLSGASLAAMGAISTAAAQDDVSDEIVVTATGRSAALQDVPVAVTAVTGEQMENSGVQDLRDITQLAPSFAMGTGQSSAATTARIRGIGTGGDNVGFEAAVGIFIDGVYRARAGAALADLPELERVEILRGPQGTLFGRNTSAGALSVVTASPGADPGMNLEVLYGIDDLQETGIRAGVNVPLSDTFAISVDGSARARDGYITDIISGDDINDRNRWSARAQALWDISPDASLRVIVDGAESDEVCCGTTPLVYGSTQAIVSGISSFFVGQTGSPAINLGQRLMSVTPSLSAHATNYNLIAALGFTGTGTGFPVIAGGLGLPSFPIQPGGPARNYGDATDDFGISGQLDWDLGGISLTSITAYRDWEQNRNQDIDFHSADVAFRYGDQVGVENFTQELRFNGEFGRLNWLAGVFYSDETTRNVSNIQVGAHSNIFVNLATIGNTAGQFAIDLGGCELFDTTSGDHDVAANVLPDDPIPSLFYCASGNALLANAYLSGNINGQGQQADTWETNTESISAFMHNEIALSDALTLTVGARFTQEDKAVEASLLSTSYSCQSLQTIEALSGIVSILQVTALSPLMNLACNPAINPISNGNWQGSTTEEEWSGTASLAYNATDDLMFYGGYSRGYKAGGFNMDRQGFSVTPATINNAGLSIYQTAFAPEFTDAYEVGMKSTIFGGSTTLNLAGFYQQIHDYQLNAYNGFNFITRNVPELISQGMELEVSSRPTDNLFLTAGVTYTDAYYDSTIAFNPLTLAAFCPPLSQGCSADPNSIVSGTPLALSPEWAVTGAIAYTAHFANSMQALFYLDARWNSEYRTQTLGRDPLGRTDNQAYAVFNGRISFGPESEHWSIDLWGQNLTDEQYFVGAFQPPLQNSYIVYPNEPNTYGVTIRARY